MADLLQISIDDRVPQALRTLLSPELLERVLDIVAAAARNEWIKLARRELHTSKGEYIRGIQPVEVSPHTRVIALVGWLANAVETGLESFDLRETLLGPRSTIRRKAQGGGFFARVPFRHSGPDSKGQAGTPMGSSYGPAAGGGSRRVGGLMPTDEARDLGRRIYDVAKRLSPTKAGAGMKTQWGDRLPPGMAPLLRGPNPSHPDPRMRRGHVTDIYSGMVRERHTYEKKTQTQYMTWRTISTRVVHGWIHPGITAHHLADKVGEFVARIAPATFDKVVKAGMGEQGSGPGSSSGGSGGSGPFGSGPWELIR